MTRRSASPRRPTDAVRVSPASTWCAPIRPAGVSSSSAGSASGCSPSPADRLRCHPVDIGRRSVSVEPWPGLAWLCARDRDSTHLAITPRWQGGGKNVAAIRTAMPRRLLLPSILATLLVLFLGCNGADSRVRGTVQSGDSAARQRALREALHYYRAAAAAEPASLDAQTRRGGMAEVLGEFDEALDAYARAARLEPSARAYQRAGTLAERMGNTAVAIEYLNASLNAQPTRSERMARSGLRWVEGIDRSLNASRLARMLPDWVFRLLNVGRVVLAGAGVDHDVTARVLFMTLLESGDSTRALDVARSRGWVREGVDHCTGASGPREAETRALVGMLVAPERTDCLLRVGRSLTDNGMVRLARIVLLDRSRNSTDARVRGEALAFMARRPPAHAVPKLAASPHF